MGRRRRGIRPRERDRDDFRVREQPVERKIRCRKALLYLGDIKRGFRSHLHRLALFMGSLFALGKKREEGPGLIVVRLINPCGRCISDKHAS